MLNWHTGFKLVSIIKGIGCFNSHNDDGRLELNVGHFVAFARKSEFPGPDDLFEGMWANPIPKP